MKREEINRIHLPSTIEQLDDSECNPYQIFSVMKEVCAVCSILFAQAIIRSVTFKELGLVKELLIMPSPDPSYEVEAPAPAPVAHTTESSRTPSVQIVQGAISL